MIKTVILFLSIFLLTQTVSAKKEVIRFNLKFGFVKGGEAIMIITDTIFNGKAAIHYHVTGKTTGLAQKLYGVNDVYETIVDAESHLPLKAIRNIREQKYRWYNKTYFYHDIDSLNSQKSGWREMPENMVDLISSFFYFVNTNSVESMEANKSMELASFHADKIDTIMIQFQGYKKVKTNLGEVETFALRPVVDKGKLLKRSNGLKFYISKEQKIPVLLEFEMKVGALKAVLRSYKIDGIEQVTK